jgi:hypothetical protein
MDLCRLDDPATYDEAVRLLAALTDDLLDDVHTLDTASLAAPSLLPGWTRAHVLAHVARNADALVNLLTWARTGQPRPMYADRQQRDAEIEAGGNGVRGMIADEENAGILCVKEARLQGRSVHAPNRG